MDLSKKKITDKGFFKYKVLYLVDKYFDGNGAEFLRKSNLSHSYLDNLKKKEDPEPSVRAITKMIMAVKKVEPRFNPQWMISDSEPIHEVRENITLAAEDDKIEQSLADQDSVPYSLINQAFVLLSRIEQKVSDASTDPLPGDVELVLSRLLNTSLERRHKDQNSHD